jgi:secreted PhoX family phosphatase
VPIVAMGRFRHEAVIVDARTGNVYLTEDREDGLIYRYRPDIPALGGKHPRQMAVGDLARGGTLEALGVQGSPGARTQNWGERAPAFQVGVPHQVHWIPLRDVDPDMDMERDPSDPAADALKKRPRTAATSLRSRGYAAGAAQFARNEGVTHRGREIYFCATNGGQARLGQVWKLDLDRDDLTLLVEPNDGALLDGPDNITVAPHGDLVICEDGMGENFLNGVTRNGRFYRLARNAFNQREFAGACFSHDGRTLFVNIQEPGLTFAIWGPWKNRRG